MLEEKTKAQTGKSIESTMEEIAAKERSLLEGKEPLGHRYGEDGEPADEPYACEEEVEQLLGQGSYDGHPNEDPKGICTG